MKSAFQRDDSTASFHHHARRHSPSLLLCFFYKAWPTDPIGSSQEPRLHATIAILGSVSSVQLLYRVHLISWKKDYVKCVRCMTSYDPRYIPGSVNKEDVTTYQERLGSFLKKTYWKLLETCYGVSRACWKLLEEAVSTYQEHLGSYLKNMSWILFEEDVAMYQEILEVTCRSCYDVARASWKFIEKMLRHSKSVLEVY